MSADPKTFPYLVSRYSSAVDTAYGYRQAEKLLTIVNSNLGGRQAGSRADREVCTYLEEEMRQIGLKKVRKEAFPVDTWQFNGACLKVLRPSPGTARDIQAYSYASGGTGTEGIRAELVFAGKGARKDYDGLDVKGKIVLIDIDMENDWWINYPTLEAAHQGAAALINSCSAGYGQLNDRTMNTQDFCGPVTIPSVNIAKADAACLKDFLSKGPVQINLQVDNVVHPGGTSWNVLGEIPGKSSETRIIVGDHHDCHFYGFQDNNTGVAAALTIAKAMVDSGFQPEHDLIFILHGAEEWGAIDNRYDWQVGAWHQIHTLHPEWVGSSLAFINFEMPGMSGSSSFTTHATPEFHSFLQEVYRLAEELNIPRPKQFTRGFGREDHLLTTWSDAWTYANGGIPSFENFAGYRDGDTAFSENIYHSNFDTSDLFQEDVFTFNVVFYALLAMVIDRIGHIPLDFTAQADRLKAAADFSFIEEIAGPGIVYTLEEAVTDFRGASENLKKFYKPAASVLDGISPATPEQNRYILDTFRAFQESLVRLDWEDSQVYRFEQKQKNIPFLKKALAALDSDNAQAAAEALAGVDDNLYALYFSRPVVQHEYEQLFGEANRGKLFWGAGGLSGYHDFYDVIAALQDRSPEEGAETRFFKNRAAIRELTAEVLRQEKEAFAGEIQHTIEKIKEITEKIQHILRGFGRL